MCANKWALAVQLFYLALLTQLLLELHKHLVLMCITCAKCMQKDALFCNTRVACIRLRTIAAWCASCKKRVVDERAALVQNLVSPLSTSRAKPFFLFGANNKQEGLAKSSLTPFRNWRSGKLLPPTRWLFLSAKKAYVVMPKSRSWLLTFFWKSQRLKSLLCAPGSKYTHIRRDCCRIERSVVGSERKGKKVSCRSTAAN